ncbi:lytic transglycosylase domain-containing protein, partial [Pseudomonas aeruginosa]
MAAAIGTPGRVRRPSRVAIRCASAALLLATGGWAL